MLEDEVYWLCQKVCEHIYRNKGDRYIELCVKECVEDDGDGPT